MRIKLWDVKISVSVAFAAMIAVVLLMDATGIIAMGLLAAFFHESGHIIAGVVLGIKPKEINFTPFGIRMRVKEGIYAGYGIDAMVAFAGPLMNLVLFAGCYAFHRPSMPDLILFGIVNLIIATFNLLPIAPLDGGRMLTALFCKCFGVRIADIIINVISFVILVPCTVAGLLIVFRSRYNYTLLLTSLYLMSLLIAKGRD